jgi:Ser/Thr protein kinase RdoA (MazF antagonist)
VTDAAVVGRILRDYRLGPVSVRRRYGSVSGAWVGYELDRPGGDAILVRAYRADLPLPEYLRGSGTASVTDWLLGRAATLDWLAARGYPAPRVVATRTGDLVGVEGAWLTWATSYIHGRALPRGGGLTGPLGAALGRLHALGAPEVVPARATAARATAGRAPAASGPGRRPPGPATWHPATAIPAALRRLDAVAALLPEDWRPLHAQFRATLLAVQQAAPGLPTAVVHGDAWPGNAVAVPGGEVVLTGWEDAGLGLPLLDLGQCLLDSHLDPGPPRRRPEARHIEPDPGRIAAVLDGYTRWRPVIDAEREALADGIRFGAAYAGAIHLERALIDGVHGPTMDARLGRLKNRIAVSQAIADLAACHLGAR